ncbi:MAG: hypothetical protein HY774_09430 [Acidobacteria bacterium]|nr:hypothetical protein [Acidobacteriota bacterium]
MEINERYWLGMGVGIGVGCFLGAILLVPTLYLGIRGELSLAAIFFPGSIFVLYFATSMAFLVAVIVAVLHWPLYGAIVGFAWAKGGQSRAGLWLLLILVLQATTSMITVAGILPKLIDPDN